MLSLTEDTTEHLLEKLSLGRLDMLVLAMPCLCDGTETLPLWQDPFHVVMPEGHDLSHLTHVPVERLENQRMIMMEDGHCLREQTLAVCRQGRGWDSSDGEGDSTFTATSLQTMVEMVELSLGIGVVPALAIENGLLQNHRVVARPLSGGPVWRTIGLAWRPRSPRAADFHTLASAFATLAPANRETPRPDLSAIGKKTRPDPNKTARNQPQKKKFRLEPLRNIDSYRRGRYVPTQLVSSSLSIGGVKRAMKIRNSLKSAKVRDKDCRVVRRRGRVYVINKKNPRMKARQG